MARQEMLRKQSEEAIANACEAVARAQAVRARGEAITTRISEARRIAKFRRNNR
jgi:hypothetical protein